MTLVQIKKRGEGAGALHLMRGAIAACLMMGAGVAFAQTVSPELGGASVEDLQHGIRPRQIGGAPGGPAIQGQQPAPIREPAAAESTIPVEIKGFHLVGQTVFDQQTLLQVAQAKPGDYTLAQLEAVAARIRNYYREQGFMVADAVIPPQNAKNGVIEIRVIEGMLEAHATIVDDDPVVAKELQAIYEALVCPSSSEGVENSPPCKGVLATDAVVQRVVLLARENTGKEVYGSLSAGAELGYTHLSMTTQPGRALAGEVTFDNSGSSSTGKWHAQGHIVANSLLGVGDTLDLVLGVSNEPARYKFFQADYSVPLGAQGWRVGANVGQTQYSLGGAFAAMQSTGVSRSVGLYARYPLALRSDMRTDLTFSVKSGQLRDTNVAYENPRIFWQTSADLAGRIEDNWLGTAGLSLWGVRLDHGGVRITDATQEAIDSSVSNTRGVFNRVTLRGSREQGIGGGFSVFGSLTTMLGDKNLDPYFKFSLGGPYAVRAYPSGEASGDQGVLGTLELRYVLPSVTLFTHTLSNRFSLFYDKGWVRDSRFPAIGVTQNTDLRAGAGVQLELTDSQLIGLRLFWATAVGTGVSVSDGARSRVGVTVNAAF